MKKPNKKRKPKSRIEPIQSDHPISGGEHEETLNAIWEHISGEQSEY